MKRALTTLAILAAAAAMSATCLAQTPGPSGTAGTVQTTPAKKHNTNFKVMWAAEQQIDPTLNLSKSQQDQVDSLNRKTQDDAAQIKKDTKGDKEARKTKMTELGQNYEKQFNSILNVDQMKEYRKAYKAFMKKWHEDHKKKAVTPSTSTTTPSGTPKP
jgi:hypothetical protein